MSSIGFATLSVIPSARGFGPALSKGINPQMRAAGSAGGKQFGGGMLSSAKSFVAPMAGLFAVGAGVAFFKGAVDGASDLAESASKVKVVFGAQAAAIVAASKTSATAMGLSKSAYLEAAGGLGNLLVSLKIAPDAVSNMSQEMVKLASDMASFNNVPVADALLAIRSGLTGETEPLKRFGVNMNETTLKAQALAMGLIFTTKEALNPQTKALAAQALIMAQTGTAQGDFARTSAGLANQQKILAARTADLKVKIGDFLLPTVTQFTTFVSNNVLPAVDKFIKGFKDGSGAGGTFRDVLTTVGAVLVTTIAVVKGLTGFLIDNKNTIGAIAGIITLIFLPALLKMGVQAAISGAQTVALWLMIQSSAIAATATSVAQFIIQGAKWVWLGVQATATGVKMAAAWVIGLGPIAWVSAAIVALAALVIANWDTIKNATVAVWNWVVGFFRGIPNKLINALGDMGSLLYNAGSAILSGLWQGMKDKFASVKNFVSGIGSWIAKNKGPLGYDFKLLIPAGNAIMAGFNDGLTSGFDKVKTNVLGFNREIASLITAPRGAFDFGGAPSRPSSPVQKLVQASGSLDFATPEARNAAVGGNGNAATSADIAALAIALADRFDNSLQNQARLQQTFARRGSMRAE